MDANTAAARRPAHRQGLTLRFILLAVAALPFVPLGMGVLTGGCTAAQQATVAKTEAAVMTDATSPAGQAILADVTTGALNVGLDAATGNDAGAVIAGIQGAASAMRDYEGLPTAPNAGTIANAAAVGSGVGKVASIVAPSIETIIGNATKSAATQKVSVSINSIIEAAARGLDAVAAAKVSQARARQAAALCYAELRCEGIARQ